MPDLVNYLIQLIVPSVIFFALRKQKFSIATHPEQFWKPMIVGWCIGMTILFV